MAKYRSIKNSLLGGQISPTCVGRTDLPQYPHCCEILQNMIPLTSGGGYRRPGTLNVDSVPITTGYAPRIMPFIASRTEAYALWFGKNVSGGSQIVESYRATGNGTGQFQKALATGNHPYAYSTVGGGGGDDEIHQVQYVQSVDEMFLVHPNRKPQIVSRTGVDTFSIADFDNGLSGVSLVNAYPYLNQNTTATTITPSATTGAINLTASASVFNANHVGAIFVLDYGSGNVGAVQITAYTSGTSVSATVIVTLGGVTAVATWWESAWSNYRGWPRACSIFLQRLVFAGNTHQPDTIWFSQSAGYTTFSRLCSTFKEPSYLPDGSSNPTAGTSHTVNYPDDSSEGNGYSTGPAGSEPFRITLSQSQLDRIQWLSSDKELLIGTESQEWLTSAQNGAFDVGNSPLVLQSKYGSDWVPAVRIGYELIMPMITQDELVAYQYNYIDASFFAEPVQMLFDEYPQAETGTLNAGRRKFRSFQWDVTRKTLWCSDTAGNFFGMTRDRKLGVTSWHTHQFGGFNASQGSAVIGTGAASTADAAYYMPDGSVLSFCILPNQSTGINDVWLVVKRTVSGVVNFQLERMMGKNTVRKSAYSSIAPGGTTATEPLSVDAAVVLTDNAAGIASLTYAVGTYLNGYTLTGTYYSLTYGLFKITSNGAVSAGNAILNTPLPADYGAASPFHVFTLGLPYSPIVQPVRSDAGSVIGTAQAAVKRNYRAFIRLYKTLMCKIGSPPSGEDGQGLETVNWAQPALMSQSPEIFTGDKKVLIRSTYDRDGYIYIVQDQPLPFTLVSIIEEGDEFD